jgi:phosphatidylserine/phosphatidylglycerophosphate/cardiolipin synthase-like enzyme
VPLPTWRVGGGAIERAKSIKVDAYVLGARGAMVRALDRAADRGADVSVDLCEKKNAFAAKELRDHGVRVVTAPPNGSQSLHGKVAVVDNRVFYDDRNWRSSAGDDLIVETGIDDALPLRSKAQVIADEATQIRCGSGHRVLVSTESFGPGPIARALLERAQRGDDVRLIYNPGDVTRGQDRIVAELHDAGVRIEESTNNHKFACTGDRVWLGSANATVTGGETGTGLEWGTVLHGTLAAKLDAQAERLWDEARPPLHRDSRT